MAVSIDLVLFLLGSVKFIFDRGNHEEFSDGIDVGLNIINMYD